MKYCARDAVFFRSQQRTAETGMASLAPLAQPSSEEDLMLTHGFVEQALFYVCSESSHVLSTLDADWIRSALL